MTTLDVGPYPVLLPDFFSEPTVRHAGGTWILDVQCSNGMSMSLFLSEAGDEEMLDHWRDGFTEKLEPREVTPLEKTVAGITLRGATLKAPTALGDDCSNATVQLLGALVSGPGTDVDFLGVMLTVWGTHPTHEKLAELCLKVAAGAVLARHNARGPAVSQPKAAGKPWWKVW